MFHQYLDLFVLRISQKLNLEKKTVQFTRVPYTVLIMKNSASLYNINVGVSQCFPTYESRLVKLTQK